MSKLMKLVLGLAFWPALVSDGSCEAALEPQARQPFEIVRSIEAVQDQVVLGNAVAKTRLPKLIRQLGEHLLAASPDVWRDSRNAGAAIIYTLSGGSPKVLRKAINAGLSPAPDLELMRGTLAYAEDRREEAKKRLGSFDAFELTPTVGGHVAMAQAALASEDDPSQAMKLLDKARLMLPGTLVEEAALRRGLLLAEKLLDAGKFEMMAREYVWRFPKSEYFESFRHQFASAITHFALSRDAGEFAQIERLAALAEPASQCGLYLEIAYQGIIGGKIAAARLAAIKAKQLAGDGAVEQGRAALYEAAALVLKGDIEIGARELGLTRAMQLPGQDEDLKKQVASLIRQIGDPADKRITSNLDGKAGSPAATSAAAGAADLIDLAQQKLGQADKILHGKTL